MKFKIIKLREICFIIILTSNDLTEMNQLKLLTQKSIKIKNHNG